MAQLFRVTKLHDSSQSQTFTFVLPPATAADYPPEILSRDFAYAGHKWRLSLLKKDKHLSPYVQLTTLVEGLRCTVDFSFVLINRESFTQNESFADKQKEFFLAESTHGRRTFVTLEDLNKRRFSDSKGEYILEVNFKNPKTTFEQSFSMTSKTDARTSAAAVDYQRYDTRPFQFGDLEWVCVFCPNMDTTEEGLHRHMIQITRKSKLDSLCKLTYRVVIGDPAPGRNYRSELREDSFDFSGNGENVYFTEDYLRFVDGSNQMKLTLELIKLTYVNHLKLNVLGQPGGDKNDKTHVAQFSDKDKQNWCVAVQPSKTSNTNDDDFLTLSLLYPDLPNIPRNYLRFVCWSMQVVASKGPSLQPSSTPYECYYAKLEEDKGYAMKTNIKWNELKTPGNNWLSEKENRLIIEIEWLCTYLLLHPSYHPYDDIYRKHIAQMRREVQALQAENYSLEKELHSYHMSIANKVVHPNVPLSSSTPPPNRRMYSNDSISENNGNSTPHLDEDVAVARQSPSPCSIRKDVQYGRMLSPHPNMEPASLRSSCSSDLHAEQIFAPMSNDATECKQITDPTSSNHHQFKPRASLSDSPTKVQKLEPPPQESFFNRYAMKSRSMRAAFPRKFSNPMALSNVDISERKMLTRRTSERHSRSADHSFNSSDKSTESIADRAKSASPYPSDGEDTEGAFAMCKNGRGDTAALGNGRKAKNRRSLKNSSLYSGRGEAWTFHFFR